MKPNVGGLDKMLRLVAGGVIVALGVFSGSWWGLIGLIPIATAMFRWCPVYLPFGISTCPGPGQKQ